MAAPNSHREDMKATLTTPGALKQTIELEIIGEFNKTNSPWGPYKRKIEKILQDMDEKEESLTMVDLQTINEENHKKAQFTDCTVRVRFGTKYKV